MNLEKELTIEDSKYISVFNNSFVQHLFFDSYIKEGNGNNSSKVCKIFNLLVNEFNLPENGNGNNNSKIRKLSAILENAYSEKNIITANHLNDSLNKSNYIFLSGWSRFHPHAITQYITKNNENETFTLHIFNSGMGMNNHYKNKNNNVNTNDLIGNIGIKYDNLTLEEIKKIYILNYSLDYFQSKQTVSDITYNEYIKLLNICNQICNNEFNLYIGYNVNIVNTYIEEIGNIVKILKEKLKSHNKNTNSINEIDLNKLDLTKRQDDSLYKPDLNKFDKSILYENISKITELSEINEENEKKINNIINKYVNYIHCLKKYITTHKSLVSEFGIHNIYELLYNDYDESNIDDFYYKTIHEICNNQQYTVILKDIRQLSGSCSFYSLYYFIKYYFLTNLNNDKFIIFDNFIKERIIDIIIRYANFNFYMESLDIESYNLYISNIALLIKDYNIRRNELFEIYGKLSNYDLSKKIIIKNEEKIAPYYFSDIENIIETIFEDLENESNPLLNIDSVSSLMKKYNDICYIKHGIIMSGHEKYENEKIDDYEFNIIKIYVDNSVRLIYKKIITLLNNNKNYNIYSDEKSDEEFNLDTYRFKYMLFTYTRENYHNELGAYNADRSYIKPYILFMILCAKNVRENNNRNVETNKLNNDEYMNQFNYNTRMIIQYLLMNQIRCSNVIHMNNNIFSDFIYFDKNVYKNKINMIDILLEYANYYYVGRHYRERNNVLNILPFIFMNEKINDYNDSSIFTKDMNNLIFNLYKSNNTNNDYHYYNNMEDYLFKLCDSLQNDKPFHFIINEHENNLGFTSNNILSNNLNFLNILFSLKSNNDIYNSIFNNNNLYKYKNENTCTYTLIYISKNDELLKKYYENINIQTILNNIKNIKINCPYDLYIHFIIYLLKYKSEDVLKYKTLLKEYINDEIINFILDKNPEFVKKNYLNISEKEVKINTIYLYSIYFHLNNLNYDYLKRDIHILLSNNDLKTYSKKGYNLIPIQDVIRRNILNKLRYNPIPYLYEKIGNRNDILYIINDNNEKIILQKESIKEKKYVTYLFNNEKYYLVDDKLRMNKVNQIIIINILLLLEYNHISFLILKNKDKNKIIILLPDYKNIIFNIEINNKNCDFYLNDIKNNKKYTIITKNDKNKLLNEWIQCIKNGFLLKNKNTYYLLLLCTPKILNNITIYSELSSSSIPYLNKKDLSTKETYDLLYRRLNYQYSIIELHHTLLYTVNDNIDSLNILFISLSYANKNNLIYLFYEKYYNALINDLSNSNYSKIIKHLIENIKINIAYWALFKSTNIVLLNNENMQMDIRHSLLYNIEEDNYNIPNQSNIFRMLNSQINNFENIYIKINELMNGLLNELQKPSNKKNQLAQLMNSNLEEYMKSIIYYCNGKNNLFNSEKMNHLLNQNIKNVNLRMTSNLNDYQKIEKLILLISYLYDNLSNYTYNNTYNDLYNNVLFSSNHEDFKYYIRNVNTTSRTYGKMVNISNILMKNVPFIYINMYLKNVIHILNELLINKDELNNCIISGEICKAIDPSVIISSNQYYTDINGNQKRKEIYEILFEIESNNYIRKQQKEFIDMIYSNINNSNNYEIAYQLLMGRGKSSVITPLIIMKEYFMNNQNKFCLIIPETLIPSAFKELNKYTKYMKNVLLYNYSNIKENIDYKKREGNILLISDKDAKTSYLVKKTKNSISNNNVNNILNNEYFYILDEIDSMIDPLKSNLNLLPDEGINPPNLLDKFEEYWNISLSLFKELKELNSNSNSNSTINIENINNKELLESIYFIKKHIYNGKNGYGFGYYNVNNQNKIPFYKIKYLYTSIPYLNVNDPLIGSKFSNINITIISTIISYMQEWFKNKSIRLFDFLLYIHEANDLDKNLGKFNVDLFKYNYPTFIEIYTKRIKSKNITSFINNLKIYYKNILDVNQINEDNINYFNRFLIKNMNDEELENLLKEYLKNIIFRKYFKINNTYDNISFIDIMGMIKKKIMFTGTTDFIVPKKEFNYIFGINENNHNPNANIYANHTNQTIKTKITKISNKVCNTIIEDNYSNGAIKSAILGLITRPPQFKIFNKSLGNYRTHFNDLNQNEKDLMNFLFTQNNIKEYDALIDVCGLIIDMNLLTMVRTIFLKFNGKRNVYFVENGVRKVCTNIIENNLIINDYTGNLIEKNAFIYYDNKHIVGIDFTQNILMNGLVIVNEKSKLTDVAQGIFRLRKLNITHTFDFYIQNNFLHLIENFEYKPNKPAKYNNDPRFTLLENIYNIFVNNGIKYKETSRSFLNIQCIKYLVRELNNKNKIWYNENIKNGNIKFINELNKYIKNVHLVENEEEIPSIQQEQEQDQEEEEEQEQEYNKSLNIISKKNDDIVINYKLNERFTYRQLINCDFDNLYHSTEAKKNIININNNKINILGKEIVLNFNIYRQYNTTYDSLIKNDVFYLLVHHKKNLTPIHYILNQREYYIINNIKHKNDFKIYNSNMKMIYPVSKNRELMNIMPNDYSYTLTYFLIFQKEFDIRMIYKVFKYISTLSHIEQLNIYKYYNFFAYINKKQHNQINMKIINETDLFNIFDNKETLFIFFKLNIFDNIQLKEILLQYIKNKITPNRLIEKCNKLIFETPIIQPKQNRRNEIVQNEKSTARNEKSTASRNETIRNAMSLISLR